MQLIFPYPWNCNTSEQGAEKLHFWCQSFKKELSLADRIFNSGSCEPSAKINVFRRITHVWPGPTYQIKADLN